MEAYHISLLPNMLAIHRAIQILLNLNKINK